MEKYEEQRGGETLKESPTALVQSLPLKPPTVENLWSPVALWTQFC